MAIVPEYETEGTVWNNSDSCDDIARGTGGKACHATSSQPSYIYWGEAPRRGHLDPRNDMSHPRGAWLWPRPVIYLTSGNCP